MHSELKANFIADRSLSLVAPVLRNEKGHPTYWLSRPASLTRYRLYRPGIQNVGTSHRQWRSDLRQTGRAISRNKPTPLVTPRPDRLHSPPPADLPHYRSPGRCLPAGNRGPQRSLVSLAGQTFLTNSRPCHTEFRAETKLRVRIWLSENSDQGQSKVKALSHYLNCGSHAAQKLSSPPTSLFLVDMKNMPHEISQFFLLRRHFLTQG